MKFWKKQIGASSVILIKLIIGHWYRSINLDKKDPTTDSEDKNKIKEIIHIKAIELDCINENDALLDQFSIGQFDEILTEIKRLVNEFFNN